MRKLGKLLGKTTAQTKNLAKSTKSGGKAAISKTKSTLVTAKDDFVAGYKEQAGGGSSSPIVPESGD